jgi:hypothetical protein
MIEVGALQFAYPSRPKGRLNRCMGIRILTPFNSDADADAL